MSGYNGNIDNRVEIDGSSVIPDHITALRNQNFTRDDGNPYVWPKDIVPYRIYVGKKGKLEDGSDAPEDDFLARNGLKFGQLYGFAIDMSETGPTGGVWRDEWHKSAVNGDMVPGKMIAQEWRWDGEVKNFEHDGKFWDDDIDLFSRLHVCYSLPCPTFILLLTSMFNFYNRIVGLSESSPRR